jgi:hypothetical protein
VDAFTLFLRVLYLVRMRQEWEDKLWWVPSKRGLFGVQSSYNTMGCNDGFRRTKVPLRVAFFVWPAALGRSLPWTISESSISLWLIGVVCVKEMGVCTPSSSFFDE